MLSYSQLVSAKTTVVTELLFEYLECLGVKIDPEKNKLRGDDIDFTGEGSTIKTFIIPTDEELMIAQDTMELLSK